MGRCDVYPRWIDLNGVLDRLLWLGLALIAIVIAAPAAWAQVGESPRAPITPGEPIEEEEETPESPDPAPAEAPETEEAPAEAPETEEAPAEAPETEEAPAEAPETEEGPAEAMEPEEGPAEATEPPEPEVVVEPLAPSHTRMAPMATEPAEVAETAEAEEEAAEEEAEEVSESTGANCLGHAEGRWVYHHLVVLKYNPLGVEYRGRVGVCAPFITNRGVLFDLSRFELGIAHELSPAYMHLGGYLQFAPLSILSFRATATGLVYWEFPLNRAAYYPVQGYGAPITSDLYPPEDGRTTTGWNINLQADFQVKFDIGPLAMIILDSFAYEFWRVGDEEYYINLRHDVVMRGYDQVIANEAMLMLEYSLPSGLALRLGAFDSLRWVADAEHQNHHIGALAMVAWPELPRGVRGLTLFLRVGWYADRSEADAGPTVIYLGLLSSYDLGAAVSSGR